MKNEKCQTTRNKYILYIPKYFIYTHTTYSANAYWARLVENSLRRRRTEDAILYIGTKTECSHTDLYIFVLKMTSNSVDTIVLNCFISTKL
jgi:hypothetical protein